MIIPTYNRCSLVRLAVESVLCQTHTDFELIVVDDGSTDGTGQALAAYGDRLKYLYQENAGESVARQRGIEIASGGYIAFLDSDDLWLAHKLEKQLEVLVKHPNVGWVYSGAYAIDRSGARLGVPPLGCKQRPEDFTLERFVLNNLALASTLLVRRVCFGAVGGFDHTIQFAEDWDLCLRLATSYPVACVPEPLAEIRLHQRGWLQSADNLDRMLSDHLRILDKFFALPGSEPLMKLKAAAMAQRHAFAAFEYYAYGNTTRGKEELELACRLAPEIWGHADGFMQIFAEHAMLLVDIGIEADALKFAQTVAANLPAPLGRADVSAPKMLGWTHIVLANRCRQMGDQRGVRSHIVQAACANPAWLKHRGTISLFVRSLPCLGETSRTTWADSCAWGMPWVADATTGPVRESTGDNLG